MSDDERALIGRARRISPVSGVPRPVSFDDECTGRYEGEELRAARAARAAQDPAARIALLEAGHKELGADVNEIKVSVADIRGDQKAQNASLSGIEKTLERMAQREHVTFTAKVDVDKAQRLDMIESKKDRRQLAYKIVGGVAGGGLLIEVLHRLGVL